MKTGKKKYELRILVIKGTEWWSAQCLEYDIATQAKTLEDLFYELERVFVSQIAVDIELGREPFDGIPPAPKKYQAEYERSPIRMEGPKSGLTPGNQKLPRFEPAVRFTEQAA